MTESKLQVALAQWMPIAFPGVLFFHIFNEQPINRNDNPDEAAKTAAIRGKMKKDRGVKSGVLDNELIFMPTPQCARGHAFLELKDPHKPASANKYSPSQVLFSVELDKYGIPHACCQNGDQIEAFLESIGLKPKQRFPGALDRTKRQVMQTAWAMALGGKFD